MKQFIAEIWSLIAAAKREGAAHREIHEVLVQNGFPGTYHTFYTYWLEISKMTTAQRARCAKAL
jgi:fluoride ion exporter CrcB/FEX